MASRRNMYKSSPRPIHTRRRENWHIVFSLSLSLILHRERDVHTHLGVLMMMKSRSGSFWTRLSFFMTTKSPRWSATTLFPWQLFIYMGFVYIQGRVLYSIGLYSSSSYRSWRRIDSGHSVFTLSSAPGWNQLNKKEEECIHRHDAVGEHLRR